MQTVSILLCAAAISLAATPSALAWGSFHHSRHDHHYDQGSSSDPSHGNQGSDPSHGGQGSDPWHGGQGSGSSFAVPGPTAGVGVSAVVLAGGYLWLARRRAKSRKQPK